MSEPVFFVCALQIFQRAISGERHLGCLKFGLWSLMFSEVWKALSKCIPDLVLDCIRRDSPIDQDDASRFVFGQLSIGAKSRARGIHQTLPPFDREFFFDSRDAIEQWPDRCRARR